VSARSDPTSPMILETLRLILREMVPEDADAMERILSDPETMLYYPAPFDRAGVEAWIERNRRRYQTDGHGLWAVILKSSGEVIGNCGLIKQKVDGVDELEVGYHLRRDHWGKGYATEAAQACRDYGLEHYPVSRIISLIRPDNLPSRRVAERNGMTLWKEVVWRERPHCVYAVQRP
jgi:[ribosomal protein S5]-alanine N-acetyltransferase